MAFRVVGWGGGSIPNALNLENFEGKNRNCTLLLNFLALFSLYPFVIPLCFAFLWCSSYTCVRFGVDNKLKLRAKWCMLWRSV